VERSYTNRAQNVGGDANTTSVTVRLPHAVVKYIDTHFNGRIKNRSEFLQHWAQVGVKVSESEELTEALDWALDQPNTRPIDPVVSVTSAIEYESPYEEIEPPEREDFEDQVVLLEEGVKWIDEGASPEVNEVTAILNAQLEALRSRVK
jgi:hypothetical protein